MSIIFRNLNGNPHTPIDTDTGDVLVRQGAKVKSSGGADSALPNAEAIVDKALSNEKVKKTYSQYVNEQREKQYQRFFGEDMQHRSNKYITFKHVKDNDNVVLVTSNVKFIKGQPVFITGSNQGQYLKEWQLMPVYNYELGINDAYAVKLNRNYFKPYSFRFSFDDMAFDDGEANDFDTLLGMAKKQDKDNTAWAIGRMKGGY